MKYANGDVYNGYWKYNQMNGNGIMIEWNGDVYFGEWFED
jgi:hypothetical protein